jgi:hypothetical protein
MNAPHTAALDATSISASSSTIIGSLPPSSSTTGSSRAAAAWATRLPVATLPVKTIFCTFAASSAAPAAPSPVITWSNSGSRPAARKSFSSSREEYGVNSDGFSTTALPVASAVSVWIDGKLKG